MSGTFRIEKTSVAFLYFGIWGNTANIFWSSITSPHLQWRHQKKIKLKQHNVLVSMRSHEAAFCQIDVVYQVGSFLFNLSFPFHQDNHCFPVVPWTEAEKTEERNVCWQVRLYSNTMLSFGHSFVRHLEKIILLDLWLSARLWGSCWGTHYLVSSFEVHFED